MSEEPSSDSVTEVTTTGWLQRIVQSFVGAIIGILLVIGSIVLLWWNEGRAGVWVAEEFLVHCVTRHTVIGCPRTRDD